MAKKEKIPQSKSNCRNVGVAIKAIEEYHETGAIDAKAWGEKLFYRPSKDGTPPDYEAGFASRFRGLWNREEEKKPRYVPESAWKKFCELRAELEEDEKFSLPSTGGGTNGTTDVSDEDFDAMMNEL